MVTEPTAPIAARTAIVSVSYGSTALLRTNLVPLRRQTPVEVVVVDNFYSTGERDSITTLCREEGWRLVANDSNVGFGAGVNAGVQVALDTGANRLVILNPDATIDADSLGRLVAAASEPGVVAAPTVLRPDGSVWSQGSDLYLADGRIRSIRRRLPVPSIERVTWLSGACLALSDATWNAVGGFVTDYFLYWEDVDLSYRAQRSGLLLELVEDAVVVHAEGGTQQAGLSRSGQAKSGTYYRYNIRNRLLFGAKYLDVQHWRSWLRHTPAVSWEILLQGGRWQFLHRPQVLLSAARGLLEGLKLARHERRQRQKVSSG